MPSKFENLAGPVGQVVGGLVNAFSQGFTNAKNRRWSEKMWNWQRDAALADWEMQNAYNSPSAQMERLKAAGLNPNLVYDNGAKYEAGAVRGGSAPTGNAQAPEFGSALTGMMSFVDMKMKNAQIDNLIEQNKVLQQDALLKASQMEGNNASTARTKFDLEQANRLKDIAYEAAVSNVEKTKSDIGKIANDIQMSLSRNEREIAMNAVSVKKAAQEILNLRATQAKTETERSEINHRIHNLDKDGRLKDLDLQLREMGINPNDEIYWRMLGRLLNGQSIPETLSGSKMNRYLSPRVKNAFPFSR